jgi:hypothetical protein
MVRRTTGAYEGESGEDAHPSMVVPHFIAAVKLIERVKAPGE